MAGVMKSLARSLIRSAIPEQWSAIGRALLMVAANKMDAARAAVASFERQFPESAQTRLLRASLLAKDGKVLPL